MMGHSFFEMWKNITRGWLRKVIIITLSILIFTLLYFIQPRFGSKIESTISLQNDTLLYQGSQITDSGKEYTYQSSLRKVRIIASKGIYPYTILVSGNTIEVDGFPFPSIRQLSGSFPIIENGSILYNIENNGEMMAQQFVSEIYSNDKYSGLRFLVFILPTLFFTIIGFMHLFFCEKWTFWGLLGRPILINTITGVMFLVLPFFFI